MSTDNSERKIPLARYSHRWKHGANIEQDLQKRGSSNAG